MTDQSDSIPPAIRSCARRRSARWCPSWVADSVAVPRVTRSGRTARRSILALALVATVLPGASCASAPATPPATTTLRVMTYNIFAGNDLERQSNLTRVAALIDSLQVDVVLLQEVDRATARSGRVDQAAVIAERAGMHVVFGSSMNFDGGEYGNAVLSRWPVQSSRVVPLQPTAARPGEAPPTEPRSVLHVVVSTPAGTLHVLNTHLDHRAESPARQAQVLELLAYVAGAVPRDARVVFGGDLNARPEAAEVRSLGVVFSDAWPSCGAGDGATFRSDAPDRRIDYIMLANLRCTAARVIDTTLSDHRPVVADIRW
jgi:endonuclease/exonuclease/phosphatase family metal-dependent hydrolase